MTEHLPECLRRDPYIAGCICPDLRRCEERVLGPSIRRLLIAEGVEGVTAYGEAKYRRALDAAWQAVAAVEHRPTNPATMIRSMALAAIDALRGDK